MKMSIDCEIIYKLNEKKILKYNIQMVKLEDYTTTELKKMISSFNKIVKFGGYSKLKKAELINMLRTHPKVKVEEGANAVKLSIKTDEDFEKQKKVKKEKVKKEVKKEVEKLDDVKVVVEKKEEQEPKKDKEKAVDDLLKQIKKSYEKNKPKLHKMTDTKYKDMFNKKLVELYDDVEDIYQEDLTTEKRFNIRKRFSAIIPFNKEQKKKEKPKKEFPKTDNQLKILDELLEKNKDKLSKLNRSLGTSGFGGIGNVKSKLNEYETYKDKIKRINKNSKKSMTDDVLSKRVIKDIRDIQKILKKEEPKKEKITTSLKNLAKFIVEEAVDDYDPDDQMYLLTDTKKIIKKARKVNVGDSKKGKELKDMILDNIQLEQGGGLTQSSEDQFKKEKLTELLVNDNEIYRLAFEVLNGRKATEEEKLNDDYRDEANKKFKEKQAKK